MNNLEKIYDNLDSNLDNILNNINSKTIIDFLMKNDFSDLFYNTYLNNFVLKNSLFSTNPEFLEHVESASKIFWIQSFVNILNWWYNMADLIVVWSFASDNGFLLKFTSNFKTKSLFETKCYFSSLLIPKITLYYLNKK